MCFVSEPFCLHTWPFVWEGSFPINLPFIYLYHRVGKNIKCMIFVCFSARSMPSNEVCKYFFTIIIIIKFFISSNWYSFFFMNEFQLTRLTGVFVGLDISFYIARQKTRLKQILIVGQEKRQKGNNNNNRETHTVNTGQLPGRTRVSRLSSYAVCLSSLQFWVHL